MEKSNFTKFWGLIAVLVTLLMQVKPLLGDLNNIYSDDAYGYFFVNCLPIILLLTLIVCLVIMIAGYIIMDMFYYDPLWTNKRKIKEKCDRIYHAIIKTVLCFAVIYILYLFFLDVFNATNRSFTILLGIFLVVLVIAMIIKRWVNKKTKKFSEELEKMFFSDGTIVFCMVLVVFFCICVVLAKPERYTCDLQFDVCDENSIELAINGNKPIEFVKVYLDQEELDHIELNGSTAKKYSNDHAYSLKAEYLKKIIVNLDEYHKEKGIHQLKYESIVEKDNAGNISSIEFEEEFYVEEDGRIEFLDKEYRFTE